MIPVRKLKKLLTLNPSDWSAAISRGIRRYVLETPDHIIIQTVEACNLSCSHCFLTSYGREISDGRKRFIRLDEFLKRLERLEGAIKKASYIQLSTFEPLLHKEIFPMMDAVLKINPRVKFPILTNGMIVTRDMLERLRKYPLHEFTVSLDGCTASTVEAFKTGVRFGKVIETIRMAVELDMGVPVGAVFVAHRDNIAELPDTIDLVAGLGVKSVAVNNLLAFTPAFAGSYLYRPDGNDEVEVIFRQAAARARKAGVKLHLPNMKPALRGCSSVEMLFVDSDGNVSPCDFLAVRTPFEMFGKTKQSAPVKFGNIFERDPLAIFRSREMRKFRNAHRTGRNIPACCIACIDAYGLMCSNREEVAATE